MCAARPSIAGFPGDAPTVANDDYARELGPVGWDAARAKWGAVADPRNMEQPPPQSVLDPDVRSTVIVPLRAANVPWSLDPNWKANPAEQWIWYRAQQISDEFVAQKRSADPFLGTVTHK